MSVMKQLKTEINKLSGIDQELLLRTAQRLAGSQSSEEEDEPQAVKKPNKKNKKTEAQPAKRGRGRPPKNVEKESTNKKSAKKPAKAEKPAKQTAASGDDYGLTTKKSERAALIAKIEKIMNNDSIDADALKAKYEKKMGETISYGRGRKNEQLKKKVILVAAANAGQKI